MRFNKTEDTFIQLFFDFYVIFSLQKFFSVIFAIGSVIMGISVTKEILLIGRVVVGAGIGLASMSVPMYISEASPPEFRGKFF